MKCQCSIPPVCLQQLSLQAREITDGWRQFVEESTSPLIEIKPGFLHQKYQNIAAKPIL